MNGELLLAAFMACFAGALGALFRLPSALLRWLLALACLAGIAAALLTLPGGTAPVALPWRLADQPVLLQFSPAALWLMGFGLTPALLATALAPSTALSQRRWHFGAAVSLLGALGVFGLQDGISFLIAWELMSLGGALMILADGLSVHGGRSVLFMLALLEVGAVALLVALLLLGQAGGGMAFTDFPAAAQGGPAFLIGLLLLVGFGAKLGILPFYEWFPGAYASGSGASGAVLSGVVLNAAFFGLSRGLMNWLPGLSTARWEFVLGTVLIVLGVLSAILAILYAFQQEDWRALLSFSSAENAAIAVTLLGVSMLFRQDALADLAGLAWTVTMLHLAGHALAKGALFLSADGVYRATGTYEITQCGLLRRSPWFLGLGALFAAMSLAAMPPQAGFVSEWYVFQTVFQGFHLSSLTGRLILALAGAGLALTAAVAMATFIKLFGIALLGDGHHAGPGIPAATSAAVFALGAGVLVLAAGMLRWLDALATATVSQFGSTTARVMHTDWLLVPLSNKFAFISPALLVIVMPLLALFPLGLLLTIRRFPIRRAPVWYGGLREDPHQAATTALAFSNALRTFYSFIYRPVLHTARQGHAYFVKRLVFNYRIAPVFGPYLFAPITEAVWYLAGRFRALQSGNMNFYLALIGFLLILILTLTLL